MKKLALFLGMAFAAFFVSGLFWRITAKRITTRISSSVKATVTNVQFINPHVQIFLDATNHKGEVEKWTSGTRSPAMLVPNGAWEMNTMKAGEVITAIGFQSRNGARNLRLN